MASAIPPATLASIAAAIRSATGSECQIQSCSSVSGGCINDVMRVETSKGHSFLLKANSNCPESFFAAEAEGLAALQSENGPRVPHVIATGSHDGLRFLVTEWIETGSRSSGFAESFGRSLAGLHREKICERFGFDRDNFIGSTPQPNRWNSDWADFFCEHRLGFQIELAWSNGFTDALPITQIDRFASRVRELLKPILEELPALIHGDLWSGNYLCDQQGRGVIIDPAVYYASREAEFGMTVLFGGFDNRFYDAYSEAYPLIDGWRERVEIYKLYHLLNHLNLFGGSYLSGCREIISRFA